MADWAKSRSELTLGVAREYGQLEGEPSPALDSAIADAISLAEKIMKQIDARWAAPSQTMTSGTGYPWRGRGTNGF